MSFLLTCDSTVDLSREHLEKRKIPYTPLSYELDGKNYNDDLGLTMPYEEFYRRIDNGSMPTTSQVNPQQYIDMFEPFLQKGESILHISFSSGISGSYGSALIARTQLLEKYPDAKFEVVDSLAASLGYGLLVDLAANVRDEGKSMEEVRDWVEDNKLTIQHWFFSTDLTHYWRGGRISRVAATVGGILKLCPLMNVSFEGKLVPRFKIRGKNRVIEETVKTMKKKAKNGVDYTGKVYITQSNCYEDAKMLADLIEKEFPKIEKPILINSIGYVIGSHTGSGTVALFFVGEKRVD